jgi:perosamine synthetase
MSNNLWRVGELELSYVKEAIENGLTGAFTKKFETRFARKLDSKYAISVNSGTSALHTAMLALGIGPGDEVIVPPLTFIATSYAVLYVGATPIFSDIDPDTFNIDADLIEDKITSRTKAIITVSLYGLAPEMNKIMDIATRNNLKVLEDNAQCVLGKYDNKTVGTFGDISIFSLQRSKHLTTGDGGVIVTNDEYLAEKCRKFADLGYRTLTAKSITNEDIKDQIQQPNFKRHELIGFNFRLPEVCAAMGLAQLDKIDSLIQKRINIANLYIAAVEGCEWLKPQFLPDKALHSYWAFTLKLESNIHNISWSDFRDCFIKNGGKTFYGAWSISYLEPSLLGLEFPSSNIKYMKGLCPIAESIQPKLIQLKTNFESIELARKQALILAETINELSI